MKVVIIQNSIKTTRIFRSSYISTLIRLGHSVTVIAVNDCARSYDELKSKGVTIYSISPKLGILRRAILLNYYIVRYMFKNHGEARVQCHFLSTIICSLPSLILFSEKCTLVIEGLGTALYRNEFLRSFFRKIFCFFSFRRVFMNSFERKELGKPSDLVMNGIGINLPNKIPEFNATSGNKEVIKIAYFGRLIKDKGVMDCFKVCDYLSDEGYDFSLDLYGSIYLQNPTSLTSDDIDEIKKKYEGSVNFHGFTNDVMERLNLIDLVVLPSKCEGFPVIVMEANSLGIPCFVYDVPGSRDSVIHGKTGFIADYANIYTMANQIVDYIKLSPDSKKKIFNYCIEISRANYCRNDKDILLSEVVLS